MTSKVGVAHKISRALTRAVYLAPPYSQSWIRPWYKHIPATTGIPQHPYEGCTYCFIHEEAHTNVRFSSCDGHQLYELGVDLEVEGVRYIEMHRGPAAYVLGPPPSRSRDLELEGGVIACHVDYVYEPQDSHVRGTE